jgi:trk system potassium uptake protein TrkA
MGSGLAKRLARSHHDITVVDQDAHAFDRLGPHFQGKVINQDALDKKSFTESGIEKQTDLRQSPEMTR